MPEITAITPQSKDKERCNVYVDGRFYCGMKLETVLSHRLRAGEHIELSELDAIQEENESAQAFDRALTHLSASMKTEKQVRDYLHKKGYVDAVCDRVLEKLRGYGFVDDAEYCAQYIRSAGKDKGARLIALELKKRGVDDRTVEEALCGLEGEEAAACSVLAKYMRNREFTRENIAKGYRHLMSKGFDHDTAKAALESLRIDPDEED